MLFWSSSTRADDGWHEAATWHEQSTQAATQTLLSSPLYCPACQAGCTKGEIFVSPPSALLNLFAQFVSGLWSCVSGGRGTLCFVVASVAPRGGQALHATANLLPEPRGTVLAAFVMLSAKCPQLSLGGILSVVPLNTHHSGTTLDSERDSRRARPPPIEGGLIEQRDSRRRLAGITRGKDARRASVARRPPRAN